MRNLLLIGLSVRITVTFLTYLIARDGTRFIIMAQNLKADGVNGLLTEQYHPFYPVLIFLWNFLVANWEYSARIAAVVMGVLTLIPLFYLTKDLFGEAVAKTAALLYCFHPYAVRFSADALSESTYIFFMITALWIGYLALTGKKKIYFIFLAGGSAALAYLTRPEGIGVFMVLALFCALSPFWKLKKKPWVFALTAFVLLFLGFTLFSSTYMAAIKNKTGYWQITTKKRNRDFLPSFIRNKLFDKNTDNKTPAKQNTSQAQVQTVPANQTAENNPPPVPPVKEKQNYLKIIKKKIICCSNLLNTFLKTYHPLLFIFMIIGLMFGLRNKTKEQKLILCIILTACSLYLYVLYKLSLSYYVSKRHALPIATILFCFCAEGIHTAGRFRPLEQILKFKKLKKITPVLILTLTCISVCAPKTFKPQRFNKKYIKDIANWINIHGDIKALYAVDDPRITFYAGVKSVTVPSCDLPLSQIDYFLKSRNPKYLLLDKLFVSRYIKELPVLIEQGHLILTSIYKYTDKKADKVEYFFYEYFK